MGSKKQKRGPDEFGDFQTPSLLADQICQFLSGRGVVPAAVVEPTCGLGSFVFSALNCFAPAETLGIEINPFYVDKLRAALCSREAWNKVRVIHQNFFDVNWQTTLRSLPEPILVLGNPPWVTNAKLGALGST